MNRTANPEAATLAGHCSLILIMVAIGSWIFFKYLAPENRMRQKAAAFRLPPIL